MKVYGQLEVAQLENVSGNPTPAPRARIYFDTADLKAKIYDGTTWKALAYESSSSAIYNAGNSGTSISLNWANGNVQRLTLTGNCLISFAATGLVDGTEYTLMIENTTTTTYGVLFNLNSNSLTKNNQPKWLSYGESVVYKFLYRATAGTQITVIQGVGAGPSGGNSGGSGTGQGIDVFSYGDQNILALANTDASNNVNFWGYRLFQNDISFGSRDLTTIVGGSNIGIRFSPSGRYLSVICTTPSPYHYVGLMSATNIPTGNAFTDAATAPTGQATSVSWHPTEKAIAVSHNTTPYVTAYPLTTAAFGAKYTNPGTLPTGIGCGVAFSPFGDFLAVLHVTSPYISVYPFNTTTGFGTKVTNPGTLPPGSPSYVNGRSRSIAWRPQGDWLLCGSATSPYLYQVPFNRTAGTFGTAVAVSGANIPTGEVFAVAFHPSGNWVAVGGVGGMRVYPFSSTTGITNASVLTFSGGAQTGTFYDLAWSEDGRTLFGVRSTTGGPDTYIFPFTGVNWYRTNDK